MTILKRISFYLAGLLGLLLMLCVTVLIYLGSSQEGARRLFELAQTWLPGELSAESLQGRLAGPLTVNGLRYRQADGLTFESEVIRFDWQPSALFGLHLHILELEFREIGLSLPKSETETAPSEPFQGVNLPLSVSVERFLVEDFQLIPAPDQEAVAIERIGFSAATEGDRLLISELAVEAFSAGMDIDGRIGLKQPLPLALNLAWRYQPPDGPVLSGKGEVSGDLQRIRLQQDLAAPISGALNATLSELLESPSWEAVLTLNEVRLAEFAPDFPATLDGRLSAQGDLDDIRLESAIGLTEPSLGKLNSELTARFADGRIKIESLQLTNPDNLRIEGAAEYHLQEGALLAELQWRGLRWPLSGEQAVSSEQGELNLQGSLDRYDYRLSMGVSRPEFPAIQVSASGAGHLTGLTLNQLVMTQHESRIEGSGEVGWSPGLQWRLALSGEKVNPALLHQDFPGALAFRLSSEGVLQDGDPQAELRLDELSGSLRDYPVQAKGQLQYRKGGLELQEWTLHSGPNLIRAKGELGDLLALDWSVDAPELATFWPGLSGTLQASGKLSGPAETPGIEASVTASGVAYQTFAIEGLDGHLDLDMAGRRPIQLSLKGSNLTGEGKRWDTLQAEISGTLAEHNLTLDLRGEQVPQLSLTAQAGLDKADNWQGQLQRLQADAPELGDWQLAEPVEYRIGSLDQQLEPFCLVSGASRVCGLYTGRADEGWRSELQVTDFGLERLHPWLTDATRLAGRLGLQAEVSADATGQFEANAELSIPQGELAFVVEGAEHRVDFSETSLAARLDPQGAVARVKLPLHGLGGLNGELSLPGFKLANADPGKQRISGKINGGIDNLAMVSLIAPPLKNSRGKLLVDFELGGDLAAPRLNGEAKLENAAFDVPELGIELRDLTLRVEAPDLDQLKVTGSVRSGGGQLSLQGTTRLDAAQGFPSEYLIEGKDWLAVDIPEAEVQLTPYLTFKHHARGSELSGQLHVPYARLRPRELPQSAVSVSSDMVVTGGEDEQQAQSDSPLHAKIRLSLGKRVSFDGFGLRGNFTGNLLVIDEPGRPVTGRGRLGIVDGVYQAYGQDLKIERGFALFADNPVENPGLDVRAVREIDEVTAGMRVTGTLKTPKLTLFSTPAMAESDVLTYLLTGRPPGESSGQTVGLAAALKASGASNLASELGRRFGLEELRVDTGSSLEEASLVAGTYLSPRLYVQYINELSTAETKLRMRYDLTDRWQLEAETGRTQAGDFFYTFER